MTEREWQRRITDYCEYLGLLWYHITDSRRTNPGFPDLVMVGPNGLVFVELKTDTGRLSKAQKTWISALEPHTEMYVWRPEDWDEVHAHLLHLSGRSRSIVAS